jgi:uncharacterized protein YhaN
MRLQSLDLVRYGKFTGKRLDFGPARAGSPDLHLVYGPNEAGKSTLFSAVLDLFFGIEGRSSYNFLHPYPAMRIGATVETGGAQHVVSRVKRQQNSLIDANDQPLPEALMSRAFGTVDRGTYQLMFSLDDDSIEKGGDSILRSEGELGSLLFSASSGLPDLGGVMTELKGRADGFYRPQARKHRLAELKAELDALKAAKNDIDVSQREFATLRKTRDTAMERHASALATRAELRVALDALVLRLEALPLLRRLRALREEHSTFGDMPDPPAVWHQMLPDLLRQETEIVTRRAQVEAEIVARTAERDQIRRDEPVLSLRAELAHLDTSGLSARYRTAAQDLPSRRQELALVTADLAARLVQLGRKPDEDGAALLLPPATIARLRSLAETHARLTERLDAARRELASAEATWREVAHAEKPGDNAAEETGAVPLDIDPKALSDLLGALRRNDFPLRQKSAREEAARLEDALSDQLALLNGRTDADALAVLPVPAEGDIAAWSFAIERLGERLQRVDERLAEADIDIAAQDARRGALLAAADFADDGQAASLRRSRDAAWQAHLASLTRQSAETFEAALSLDDQAGATRLAQTERLAETRALDLSLSDLRARAVTLRRQKAELLGEQERLERSVSEAAAACGLPADPSLPRLEVWLGRRVKILELRTALRSVRQVLAQADADEALAVSRLTGAFPAGTTLPADFETALAFAERMLSAAQGIEAERRSAVDGLKRATAARTARKADADAAAEAMNAWAHAWTEALSGTWLAEAGAVPAPEVVIPTVSLLGEIDRLVQRRNDLDHRVEAMGRDQTTFASAIARCCGALGLSDEGDPLAAFAALQQRVLTAERVEALFTRLSEEVESRERDARALAEEQERHDAAKRDMLRFFGCSELTEVSGRLQTARARAQIAERIADMEADLAARLRVTSALEAEDMLSALDEDVMRRDMAECEVRHDEADRLVQDRHAELRDAERGLEKAAGDDAAAHIEERRRTVLADIEEQALSYLRLRTGLLASEMALRLFRERHRSAMMQRASAAFATISGGEYSGLSTEMERGAEFLLVRSAAGATKLARDLSKGTRFQLYLALRMAGFHEISAAREALPFIADDIMETFDDNRSYHAFRLMAEMAGVGQVIYLTHHEHLCEIARRACPQAVIHHL